MKILFDTNIIIDVLLDRKPFAQPASFLLSKVERSEAIGFLCATTITTIHYLVAKATNKNEAIKNIQVLLSLFEIAPVNRLVLENALNSRFADFEDAVLHEAACHVGAEYIVTRDISGFKKSRVPVYTPGELINMLKSLENKEDC